MTGAPGEPPGPTQDETLHRDSARQAGGAPPAAEAPSSSSSGSLDGGRFPPGAILGSRYRIVDLLGRGGMGEVYRAEDLKLGETVALKLLPEELTTDGRALARLHQEVRMARRITHKNVVRVHDVGEAEGLPFIAMEYIDGENLASLLRRIGRLPESKALQLAREICAGLAAAHERGLLHRDIKPANVMVDGKGHARISDFGLAGLAADLERPELAGTPLYMAPEQLAEGRASFASDIYSLGLVLYEMFSGERPFRATTRAGLTAEHRDRQPSALSSVVAKIDPLIETAVARCLEREPARRPGSPLSVAALLPGGDPLAAALAAGETPSPAMVARASGQAALPRPLAAGLLALTVVSSLVAVALQDSLSVVNLDDALPTQVLAHRARGLLETAGWSGASERWGWALDDYRFVVSRREERSLVEWRQEAGRRPTFLEFWYRNGAQPLAPTRRWAARVRPDDPPLDAAGVATVRLDSRGRLRTLLLPPATADRTDIPWTSTPPTAPPDARGAPDWSPLFEAAGLVEADFRPLAPQRAPPFFAERLASWEGTYPGQTAPRLTISAATTAGRVVWWQVSERPLLEESTPPIQPDRTVPVALAVFAVVLVLGGWLAYRHLRDGRGDLRGAWRLAIAMGASYLASWILIGDHVATTAEFSLMNAAVATSALLGLAVWALYLALEPYARRLLPRQLTSWTRLLAGELGDPLVGRDLLLGLSLFSVLLAVSMGAILLRGELGWEFPHDLAPLYGARFVAANSIHIMTLIVPLVLMGILVAVRAMVRSDRWAPLVFVLVLLPMDFAANGISVIGVVTAACLAAVGSYAGLLALVGFAIINVNLNLVPVSLDPSHWWAANSWVGVGVVLALAVWSFRNATRAG